MFSSLVLLGLVFSVLGQEIDWEEYRQNDVFCVKWDIKLYSVSVVHYCPSFAIHVCQVV